MSTFIDVKPQRGAFRKFINISTRWSDNDAYKHVNNVVYFSFLDTAVNQNLIENGFLDLENSPIVGLVVDNQCQYFQSITFPDTVQVGLSVTKIGNSSVQYQIGIFKNHLPEICALGRFTHVYVDRVTNKPQSIPETLRMMFKSLEV